MLSKSLGILTANPVLFLPAALAAIFEVSLYVTLALPALALLALLLGIAYFVISVLITGAYPLMVKVVVDGGRPSATEALRRAFDKFWTLLAAGLLVVLIEILGTIALVVPGIIFATWYVYTIPAVMLEDHGTLNGMAASKAFGRDKKWSTFLMILALVPIWIIIAVIVGLFSRGGSPLLGEAVGGIVSLPVIAWLDVLISYTYITCGPLSVTAAVGAAGSSMAPPIPTQQQGIQAGAPPQKNFCWACGSSLQPGAKFCPQCGKPV